MEERPSDRESLSSLREGKWPLVRGNNLINVVVHNSADSCDASPGTIILSHVLIEEENCGSLLQEETPPAPLAVHLLHVISIDASSATCICSSDLAAALV